MKLEEVVKKYDRMLRVKRCLDGTVEVYRKSPFKTFDKHIVLKIRNKFLGSCMWVRKAIMLKDSQRFDIAGSIYRDSQKKRNERPDSRMNREIADFMEVGGESFLN